MLPDVRSVRRARLAFRTIAAVLACLVAGSVVFAAQARRDLAVSARKYAYVVEGQQDAVIRVGQGDLVRVTFAASDIAHSFTIDEYRINKRAEPDKPPVHFDFRAERAGTFQIYCSLTIDARCRKEVVGQLIVTPR